MSAAAGAERRLAAILAADVVGSSRLMEADEAYALVAIDAALHDVLIVTAARHGGRVFKTIGDGALIEFASAVAAVTCAHEVQRTLSERSADKPEDKQVRLRIGINLGDVVAGPDGDLYGDGINIAARLEPMASPGGIVISAKVYDELQGRLALAWQDWGEQTLKNITRPVRVYASGPTSASAARPTPSLPTKPSIAVLPFSNMSGDPEQEYFADGIVEDITTALSRVRWLFVIARNSSFTYKNKAIDARQIGRELGVRYLLEGSIRKAGRASGSRANSLRPPRAPTCGRTASMARSRRFSSSRIASPQVSSLRSSRACVWRRSNGPSVNQPTISTRMICICGRSRPSTSTHERVSRRLKICSVELWLSTRPMRMRSRPLRNVSSG